jgi:hypothetical protein
LLAFEWRSYIAKKMYTLIPERRKSPTVKRSIGFTGIMMFAIKQSCKYVTAFTIKIAIHCENSTSAIFKMPYLNPSHK